MPKIGTKRRIRLRAKLRARDGDRCCYCRVTMFFGKQHSHRPQYATLEHIVPASKGGTNDEGNLALSCRSCNDLKRDEHIEPIYQGGRHGVSHNRLERHNQRAGQ